MTYEMAALLLYITCTVYILVSGIFPDNEYRYKLLDSLEFSSFLMFNTISLYFIKPVSL